MTRLVESIWTRADRERSFAYVADFDHQAEWDPNTTASRRIDRGPLGTGSRFALDVRVGGGSRPMEYRITEYSPPGLVVLVGEGSGIWSEDRISFAEKDGGTLVEYAAEIRLSGLLGIMQPLLGRAFAGIAKGAAAGMKRELDALASRPAS
jgi:hypothetical protein